MWSNLSEDQKSAIGNGVLVGLVVGVVLYAQYDSFAYLGASVAAGAMLGYAGSRLLEGPKQLAVQGNW